MEKTSDGSTDHLKKETENLRLRLNAESQEKLKLEREVVLLRRIVDQNQEEMCEMREEQKQLLNAAKKAISKLKTKTFGQYK